MTDRQATEVRSAFGNECGELHIHEHRDSIVNRLARIEGHVRGVKKMVLDGRPCPELLIQIAALRSALNSVGRVILEDHLVSCVVDAVQSGDHDAALAELERALDQFIR